MTDVKAPNLLSLADVSFYAPIAMATVKNWRSEVKAKYSIVFILILSTIFSVFFMKKINVKNQEINQLAQSMADYNFIISNQWEFSKPKIA